MSDYQIDIESNSQSQHLPGEAQIAHWIRCALASQQLAEGEVSVYIVDSDEGRELNREYRARDYATNVLSFPADIPPEVELPLLGDLVVCAPVVEREAQEQHKPLDAHWAHMLIHGSLHLLGYDHIEDGEAETMEALETQLLASLGYADPYNELSYSQALVADSMPKAGGDTGREK